MAPRREKLMRVKWCEADGVDRGVDSPRLPIVFPLKPAGQIARIVYEIRQLAGLEGITSVA